MIRGFENEIDDLLQLLRKPLAEIRPHVVTIDTHPAFMGGVQDVARQVGVEAPVLVHIPTQNINAMAHPINGTLYVTDGFLKLTGDSLHTPPSKGLRMIIAHECSHLKDGVTRAHGVGAWKWAFPVAGIAAVYLAERLYGSENPDHTVCKAQLDEALEQVAQAEVTSLRGQYEKAGQQNACVQFVRDSQHAFEWQQSVWEAGKYLAGAVLGYGAWAALTRHHSLQAEFRADRMAIQIGRDAEHYIALLDKMTQEGRKITKARNSKPPAGTFLKRLEEFFLTEKRLLEDSIQHAHPSVAEREEHVKHYQRMLQLHENSFRFSLDN